MTTRDAGVFSLRLHRGRWQGRSRDTAPAGSGLGLAAVCRPMRPGPGGTCGGWPSAGVWLCVLGLWPALESRLERALTQVPVRGVQRPSLLSWGAGPGRCLPGALGPQAALGLADLSLSSALLRDWRTSEVGHRIGLGTSPSGLCPLVEPGLHNVQPPRGRDRVLHLHVQDEWTGGAQSGLTDPQRPWVVARWQVSSGWCSSHGLARTQGADTGTHCWGEAAKFS